MKLKFKKQAYSLIVPAIFRLMSPHTEVNTI